MTITVNYLRAVMHAMLALMWTPALVFAGTVTLQTAIDGVTGQVLVLVGALSSLSGATALARRIDRELRAVPGAALPRPYLFCASHMLGSWLGGAIGFMTCEGAGVITGWGEMVFICITSFSGATFVEMLVEKYLFKGQP